MSKLWFIYTNDVVSGPFTTEEVEGRMVSGETTDNCFIWWKGQREWIPVANWQKQLTKILKKENENVNSPVWYVDAGDAPVGPLTQAEMLAQLRALSNLSKVKLWSVGMEKWTGLFQLADVMDMLGMSRREHERAPLMGTVAVTRTNDAQVAMVKAASISIAGMGLNGAHSLQKNDEVTLVVKSPEFPQALHLTGSVMYITTNGYCGVKFGTVHPETQSHIFDYVKKFNQPITVKKAA